MSAEAWWYLIAAVPLLVGTIWAAVEVVRRSDLPAGKQIAWLAALVLVPVISLAAYLILRPMQRRSRTSTSRSGSEAAEQVVVAAEMRQRNEIDDAEFRRITAGARGDNSAKP